MSVKISSEKGYLSYNQTSYYLGRINNGTAKYLTGTLTISSVSEEMADNTIINITYKDMISEINKSQIFTLRHLISKPHLYVVNETSYSNSENITIKVAGIYENESDVDSSLILYKALTNETETLALTEYPVFTENPV